MNVEKSNRWTFTSWKRPTVNINLCAYLIWQTEVCPSSKLVHYQGYLETKKEYTFGQVKQIFRDKQMHVEPAKESRIINVYYCKKKRTQAEGVVFESFHYNGNVVVEPYNILSENDFVESN